MASEIPDAEQSVKRVRRGCAAMSLIVVSLSVLFVSATGNLFFLTFLIVALFLFIFSRMVK